MPPAAVPEPSPIEKAIQMKKKHELIGDKSLDLHIMYTHKFRFCLRSLLLLRFQFLLVLGALESKRSFHPFLECTQAGVKGLELTLDGVRIKTNVHDLYSMTVKGENC